MAGRGRQDAHGLQSSHRPEGRRLDRRLPSQHQKQEVAPHSSIAAAPAARSFPASPIQTPQFRKSGGRPQAPIGLDAPLPPAGPVAAGFPLTWIGQDGSPADEGGAGEEGEVGTGRSGADTWASFDSRSDSRTPSTWSLR